MTIQFAPEAIEQWPLERLRPYAKNAKTHCPDQVAKIAASMAEFGWTVPVLVSAEGEVIAVHGRACLAMELDPRYCDVAVERWQHVSRPTYVDATSRGQRIRRGAKLWTVAGSTFKAETYRFLRLPRPSEEELEAGATYPTGTVHLPAWIDCEWCKQFVGEQLVTVRNKRGFSRLECPFRQRCRPACFSSPGSIRHDVSWLLSHFRFRQPEM